MAVLAQIMPNDVPHGQPCGIHQLRRFPTGSIEQILQVGRLPGVVIDARMVHHQRERLRPLAAKVKGAQKTVLQRDIGEVVPGGIATGLVRCWFMAPANDAGYIAVRTPQKIAQVGNLAQFFGKNDFHASQESLVWKVLQGYRRIINNILQPLN